MKKIIRNLELFGCALLLTQCASDELHNEGSNFSESTSIEVCHKPFLTNSRISTTPEGSVAWNGKDRLKVYVVDHNLEKPKPSDWEKMEYIYGTDDENCKKNLFLPQGKQPQFFHKHLYDWYVMSPYSEDVKNPLGIAVDDGQTGFDLGNQAQDFTNPTSYLTKFDILTNVETEIEAGSHPTFELHHKGTLMKFTLKNDENKPLKVSKIEFEVPAGVCIGGRFAIDFKEGGHLVPLKKYNIVTLSIKNAQPINPGESYDTYVIMAPFTLNTGQNFKIRVYSDLGRFTQSAFMERDLKFMPGKMNTANVRIKGSEYEDGRIIIPDKNFENYLLDNFNLDGDGVISEYEAEQIIELHPNLLKIQSLEGIEFMPNLQYLYCEGNQLTRLDLSKNTKLRNLDCSYNKLEILNISACDSLQYFNCHFNQLKELDLQNNILLNTLKCFNNNLTSLDLSACKKLEYLDCSTNRISKLSACNSGETLLSLKCNSNALKELDISHNYRLYELDTRDNPELTTILVWDGFEEYRPYPGHGSTYHKDSHSMYVRVKDESPVCQIPDENFKKYLLGEFDRNKDGEISEFEAKAVRFIEVNTENIASLDGLRYFPNLETLTASGQASNYMGQLKSLDISHNVKLTQLECRFNLLDQLDVSRNKLLRSLDCDWNQLTQLDISANTSLETLSCENNAFRILDFGSHPALKELDCGYNDLLLELHVKEMPKLERLSFRYTPIQKLDLRDAKSIYSINCERNASLVSIDAENAQSLSQIECAGNALRSLNLRNCTSLGYVNCRVNKLEQLNVDQCCKLGSLDCSYNQLKSLNMSDAVDLSRLTCSDNRLESLDISKNKKLDYLHATSNPNLNIIYVWKGFLKSSFSCITDSHVQFVEKE